jgi:hypothetical protein
MSLPTAKHNAQCVPEIATKANAQPEPAAVGRRYQRIRCALGERCYGLWARVSCVSFRMSTRRRWTTSFCRQKPGREPIKGNPCKNGVKPCKNGIAKPPNCPADGSLWPEVASDPEAELVARNVFARGGHLSNPSNIFRIRSPQNEFSACKASDNREPYYDGWLAGVGRPAVLRQTLSAQQRGFLVPTR